MDDRSTSAASFVLSMVEFIWRLPPQGPALLARSQTVLVCGVLTSTYVGSLYIFKRTRVARGPLTRNHPKVIKARLWSVGISSLASVTAVWALARWKGLFRTNVRAAPSQPGNHPSEAIFSSFLNSVSLLVSYTSGPRHTRAPRATNTQLNLRVDRPRRSSPDIDRNTLHRPPLHSLARRIITRPARVRLASPSDRSIY
jgi:hypothetical protein